MKTIVPKPIAARRTRAMALDRVDRPIGGKHARAVILAVATGLLRRLVICRARAFGAGVQRITNRTS